MVSPMANDQAMSSRSLLIMVMTSPLSSLGVSWRSKLADGFQVGVNLIGGDLQVGLQ